MKILNRAWHSRYLSIAALPAYACTPGIEAQPKPKKCAETIHRLADGGTRPKANELHTAKLLGAELRNPTRMRSWRL